MPCAEPIECKDKGAPTGAWGECLSCTAEAGVACRQGEPDPYQPARPKPRPKRGHHG